MSKLIRKFLVHKWLVLIVTIAVLSRFWGLATMPPSLNWDEVSHGYNAYSILKTGRDEWGQFMPLIFRAYGDYKLPAYIYSTAVSEALFGVSAFAVRLTSALAGIGTIIFTYFLARKWWRGSEVLAAFLVAFEPWTYFFGRVGLEANLALFLFTGGLYFFSVSKIVSAAFFWGLTLWTYNSYRVFTPLFVLFLLLIYRETLRKLVKGNLPLVRKGLVIFLLFFVPMIIQMTREEGVARYSKVSIINDGTVAEIIEKRSASDYSPLLTRLLYNRPVYFVKKFVGNYFSHFNPDFLFFEGGGHYQFSVPGRGLLYIINLPFLIHGFYLLLKKKTRAAKVLLAWVLLAPIPSALTAEAPHALRAVTFLPAVMMITALSVIKVVSTKEHLGAYVLIISILFGDYLANYLTNYRTTYSWSWQYGYREAVGFVGANEENYAKIIVTKKYGEPHEFFLFHRPVDPVSYRSDHYLNRFFQSGWWWVDGFDKFYFVNDWEVPADNSLFPQESGGVVNCRQAKCLLITSPGNAPNNWRRVHEVKFLDGSTAFELYEN